MLPYILSQAAGFDNNRLRLKVTQEDHLFQGFDDLRTIRPHLPPQAPGESSSRLPANPGASTFANSYEISR